GKTVLGTTYQAASITAAAAPGAYVVQGAGETLQGIAQAVWGDSKLWYLIADANRLDSAAELQVGQVLRVPVRVNTVHNDADTFKPYNAADIVGSTTPAMQAPGQGGGCGAMGQIVMIAVAIVVTIYSAGVLSGAAASSFSTAMSLGAGALTTTGAAGIGVINGALAAAAGSVASQVVGNAIGAQNGFSWKAVALSAIAGGMSGGANQLAGQMGGTLATEGTKGAIARAVVSNAMAQGVGMATGLQSGFSWRNTAASAAGAAAGTMAGAALKGMPIFDKLGSFADLARGTLSGIAAGTTVALARGGKIEMARIATDAFGNALGSSLAETINDYSVQSRIAESQMQSGREDVNIEKTAWLSRSQDTGVSTVVELSNLTIDRVRRSETYLDFDPEARSLSTDSLDSMMASAVTSSKSPMSKRSLIASFRDIRDEVLNVDRRLSAKYGDDIFGKGLEQNSIYITTYAEINMANPELGWTGLAPFASNEVRASLNKFALMSLRGPVGGGNDPYSSPIPEGRLGLDASSLPGIMFNYVADGNRAVFEDIAPYLRFYQQKGINNLLNIAADIDMPNSMVEAFQTLQKSTQTSDLGERARLQSVAAKQMLYHEQRDILQPMYDHALLNIGSLANGVSSSRLQELNVQIGEKGQRGSFTITPPNPNINVSNFSERWEYASKALDTFSSKYYDAASSSTVRHNIDLMRNPANLFKISPMLSPFFKNGK
ncbi:MAG: LysM peptidoglycan-binding domain-containing protein, partial [Burkholderiales bacterium]|nr:LysM peptidoglycan-binding domain-containing protein [Anaerolineae bacterium]